MARSIAVFSAARQVHRPVQILQLQGLGASDAHVLGEPLAEAVELGGRSTGAVRHHREPRPLDKEVEAASSHDLRDDLGDPEPAPERFERVDIPVGPGVDHLPARVLGHDVLGRGPAQDAPSEPAQALGDLGVLRTPAVVDDVSLGATLARVPDALGPSCRWVITEPSVRFCRVSRRYMCARIQALHASRQCLSSNPCI